MADDDLTAWNLYLHAQGAPSVRPWQLGILVSRWVEGHLSVAEHRASGLKPFSVGPVEHHDGLYCVRVGVIGAANADLVLRGASTTAVRPALIGHTRVAVVPSASDAAARLADRATFPELLTASRPVSRVVLASLSPTYFRGSDNGSTPDAHRVFGSLRRRWRAFADSTDVDIDLTRLGLRLEYNTTRPTTAEVYRGGHVTQVTGYTGLTSYLTDSNSTDTEPMHRSLHALARLADFLGVGSSTVQGFGATRLLAVAP